MALSRRSFIRRLLGSVAAVGVGAKALDALPEEMPLAALEADVVGDNALLEPFTVTTTGDPLAWETEYGTHLISSTRWNLRLGDVVYIDAEGMAYPVTNPVEQLPVGIAISKDTIQTYGLYTGSIKGFSI